MPEAGAMGDTQRAEPDHRVEAANELAQIRAAAAAIPLICGAVSTNTGVRTGVVSRIFSGRISGRPRAEPTPLQHRG
jgi:hypothetical protein